MCGISNSNPFLLVSQLFPRVFFICKELAEGEEEVRGGGFKSDTFELKYELCYLQAIA